MKEFTCLFCGAKGIDNSRTGTRKFCNENCAAAHWRAEQGIGDDQRERCLFNEGVVCDQHRCSNCGWNPAVAQKRMEAL